jgi:hypothetical protein
MENKVQLKEQEIVGQEVVLSDIYPKTDTSSVEDIVSGSSLDLKLDRIIEMINDKLTRVVNSVNGRTGVVTLDADDVGLGNVDNVSFIDIKEWVIDELESSLNDKRFRMFDTAADMEAVLDTNDEKLKNVPFYIYEWDPNNHDYRSAIGIFKFNNLDKTLDYQYKYLNIINQISNKDRGDEVIKYDKGVLSFNLNRPASDSIVDTNALEVKTPTSNETGGLTLDIDKISHQYLIYSNIYDTPIDVEDSQSIKNNIHGIIRENQAEHPDGMKPFQFTINGVVVSNSNGSNFYPAIDTQNNEKIDVGVYGPHMNPVIIQGSADLYGETNPDIHDNSKTSPMLKYHQPMIGKAHIYLGEGMDSGSTIRRTYRFATLNPFVTWGLKNCQNFTTRDVGTGKLTYHNNTETQIATTGVDSGINVLSHPYQMDLREKKSQDTDYQEHAPEGILNVRYSPIGEVSIYGDHSGTIDSDHERTGGIFIPTDASMCTYSYKDYGVIGTNYETAPHSNKITNWYAQTPYHLVNSNTADLMNGSKGYLNPPTFVGVNLMKGMVFDDPDESVNVQDLETATFIPLSGLKVMKSAYREGLKESVSWEDLGMHRDDALDKKSFMNETITPGDITYVTGGLMVNVGDGLGIIPTKTPDSMNNYHDEGKVTVRLGRGFKFDNNGRITYNPEEIQAATGSSTGLMGIQLIDENRPGKDSALYYNLYPTTANPAATEGYHHITFGPGLGLRLDTRDIESLLVNQLTIVKLALFEAIEFTKKDDTKFTAKDYGIDPACIYGVLINEKIPEFLTVIDENDLIETAYEKIQEIIRKNNSSASYDSQYVVKSQTIYRLYLDESRYGKSTDSVDQKQITELMLNYAERHNIEVGEYQKYTDANTATDYDYASAVVWQDYYDDNEYGNSYIHTLFDNMTDTQKVWFNAIINVTLAIAQCINNRWDEYNDSIQWGDNYTSGETPTYFTPKILAYKDPQHDHYEMNLGENYRLDNSGIIASFLAAFNYDKSKWRPRYCTDGKAANDDTLFTTEKLLSSSSDNKKIVEIDGEAPITYKQSTDFMYRKNTDNEEVIHYGKPESSDWSVGDIGLALNHMYIFAGYETDMNGNVKFKVIDFFEAINIKKWCESIVNILEKPDKKDGEEPYDFAAAYSDLDTKVLVKYAGVKSDEFISVDHKDLLTMQIHIKNENDT